MDALQDCFFFSCALACLPQAQLCSVSLTFCLKAAVFRYAFDFVGEG